MRFSSDFFLVSSQKRKQFTIDKLNLALPIHTVQCHVTKHLTKSVSHSSTVYFYVSSSLVNLYETHSVTSDCYTNELPVRICNTPYESHTQLLR
jgi:hypothetical protein